MIRLTRTKIVPLTLLSLVPLTVSVGALAAAAARKPAPAVPTPAAPLSHDTWTRAAGAKATVLLFVGTECPISNGYAPDIAALARTFRAQGASVVLVYSNTGTTPAAIATHQKAFGLTALPAVLDTDQQLADRLGATCTPEAFVLDAGKTVRYHGRIDNRYAARGTAKGTGATSHELRDAVAALVAGRTVATAAAPAAGCSIEHTPQRKTASTKAATYAVTYAHDIAPILNASCVSCHRTGEIGPMPLDSFAAAQKYAANIASVTAARQMPPWKPTAECGPFLGERRLSEAQIAALKTWAATGAPLGDAKAVPAAPKYTNGWHLGSPDLILTMPASWKTAAGGPDVYRCFVLPTGLTEDKQVVAVEYRAGNKSVVHHCLGYVDTKGLGRAKDERDPGLGYTSFGGPGFAATGEMGGWAPGNTPQFLPDGIGRPLPAGSDLVLQVHYHPDGKPEDDQTSVGLYFAKKPIVQKLRVLPVVAPVRIPAGEAHYQTALSFTVPFAAKIIAVTPHMHLLGRAIALTATLPDGTTKKIIDITDWDFNWQDTYTFKEPLILPKGATVTLNATYDNSPANPRNPNNPPKPVRFGEETTDEMCIGFLSYVPVDEKNPVVRLLEGAKGGSSRLRRLGRSGTATAAAQ